MRSDPENLLSLIEKVNHWLVCKRWKKVIYGAISVQKRKKSLLTFLSYVYIVFNCLNPCNIVARKIQYRADNAVIIQRCVKMYLAVHKHRPRYVHSISLLESESIADLCCGDFSSYRYQGLMQLRKLRTRTPALAELGESGSH